MAGIPGSHAGSLAPESPVGDDENQVDQGQAQAKPVDLQAPQTQPQPAPTPPPETQISPEESAAFDALMKQHAEPQVSEEESKAFDELMKKHADEANAAATLKAVYSPPDIFKNFNPEQEAQKSTESLPAIGEMAGGGIGATVGALGGPLVSKAGQVAGTAVGGAIGKAAEQGINLLRGSKEAPKSASEAFSQLKDAAIQGVADGTIGAGAGAALEKLPVILEAAGSKFSGLSKWSVSTYANAADKVQDLWRQYGKELGGASDSIKQGFVDSIDAVKNKLNDSITQELKSNKSVVSIQPVIDKVQAVIDEVKSSRASTVQQPKALEELEKLKDTITKSADDAGKIDLKELNITKKYLQNEAVYENPKDLSTSKGELVETAAKKAAAAARELLNKESPVIEKANNVLQNIYEFRDSSLRSLINDKTGGSTLAQAGRGFNDKAIGDLQRLGELTGTDPLEQAKIYAAAKDFSHVSPTHGLQSPGGVKAAIDVGRLAAPLVQKLGGPEAAKALTQTPEGQALLGRMLNSPFQKMYESFQGRKAQ